MPRPPDHLRRSLEQALGPSYSVDRELGGGGMSRVFVARDASLGREVVVKVLPPELASEVFAERFFREIRIAAALQDPHIVPVFSAGVTADGLPYYAMPFIRGESLRDRLERGRIPPDECLSILRDLAKALVHAHQEGIVHRDIKPENILLSGGTAMVTDFGIASAVSAAAGRLTSTGMSIGSPAYMAPEQVAADPDLDHRADLYALGVVGYEMLAGQHPFADRPPHALLAAHIGDRPDPPADGPASLVTIVMHLLQKDPNERPASAAALLHDLNRGDGAARAVAVRPPSIGVLPFTNLGEGSDESYLSDGITEELIDALGKIEGLRVAARTSSFATKGSGLDARQAGKLLGVGTILEGSVRRAGQRLRVTARLCDAVTGFQLWSDRYDREMADVFELQDDLARSIAGALRVRLGAEQGGRLVVPPTRDLEAYDLFLKGRFAWNQRTETTIIEAVRCLEEAIERDPGFARAQAALASVCLNLPMYTDTPPSAAWPKAKAAALEALRQDGSLAEAHTSLGYGTMLYEWDWTAAETSFKRAIAADPSYPTAHHWYGDFLAGRGRLEEGVRSMGRAHELDPLSRVIGCELAWVLHLVRRPDEAIAHLERLLRLDPSYAHTHFIHGLALLGAGDPAGAEAALRRALDLGGFYPFAHAALVAAVARAGDRAKARRLLEELEKKATQRFVPHFALAVAFAGIGEKGAALEYLHRGADDRDVLLAENLFDPILDDVRGEAEYRRLLGRLGLEHGSTPV